MNALRILTVACTPMLALSLALTVSGCKSAAPPADDATLATQVQTHLFADQNLAGQAIQASAAKGVVTLTGSVTSDSVRTIASGDAAQVAGVRTVVNNLVVQATPALASSVAALPPPPPSPSPSQQPMPAPKAQKPSPMVPQHQPQYSPAPIVRNSPAPQPMQQPAPAVVQNSCARTSSAAPNSCGA